MRNRNDETINSSVERSREMLKCLVKGVDVISEDMSISMVISKVMKQKTFFT